MKKYLIPNGITLLGLLLGCAAVATFPEPIFIFFAVASLVCDVLDGYAARRLNAASNFGSMLDWGVDCTLAFLYVGHCLPAGELRLLCFALLLICQCASAFSAFSVRVSGRAAATIGICGLVLRAGLVGAVATALG